MPELDEQFETWKQAHDIQKHFNDVLFKIRNFYFLFIGAIGALSEKLPLLRASPRWELLLVLVPWVSIYLLDRFYYHPMLRAAVRAAESIEKNRPGLSLSTEITAQNHRSQIAGVVRSGGAKVTLFYALPMSALAAYLFHDTTKDGLLSACLVLMIFWGLEIFHSRVERTITDPDKKYVEQVAPWLFSPWSLFRKK